MRGAVRAKAVVPDVQLRESGIDLDNEATSLALGARSTCLASADECGVLTVRR